MADKFDEMARAADKMSFQALADMLRKITAEADSAGYARGLEDAKAICEGWLEGFGQVDVVVIDARTWATDSIQDIIDNIAALPTSTDGASNG